MRVNTLSGRPPRLEAPAGLGLKAQLVSRSRADRQSHIDTQTAEAASRRNGDPIPDQRIERVNIDELKSASRRVRKTSKAQLARIKASLMRFGQVNPILVDGNLTVINGHGVVEACRELDIKLVNIIRVEHLAPNDVRLLAITLNRLAETGEWDFEALSVELQELTILEEPLTITGFDQPILEELLLQSDDPQLDAKLDRLSWPRPELTSERAPPLRAREPGARSAGTATMRRTILPPARGRAGPTA